MIKKILLRSLLSFFTIAAIFIILLLTPAGLHISLHLFRLLLPGTLSYESASGTIIRSVEIHNLKYTNENNSLTIDKLAFSWKPWQLLGRKINMTRFSANTIHLTLQPPIQREKQAYPLANRFKPYFFDIQEANINNLSIGYKTHQYPLLIHHIQLKAHIIPQKINIQAQIKTIQPIPLTTVFNVNGNWDHYRVQVRSTNNTTAWNLYGSGNTTGFSLNMDKSKTLNGILSFNAHLKWASIPQWNVQLNGSHLNFKSLNPDWPSQINLQLSTQGFIKNEKQHATFNTLIKTPGVNIHLAIIKKDVLDLKWTVNISDLSHLYKKFKGSIYSEGEWIPKAPTPFTKGSIQARGFSALGYNSTTLTAKWNLYLHQTQASSLDIQATHLKTPFIQFNHLSLKSNGLESAHQLQGTITTKMKDQIAFQIRGGLNQGLWQGQLQKLTLTSSQHSAWHLEKPSDLRISKKQIATNLCLQSNTNRKRGQLCLYGNWEALTAWQFHIEGQQFNIGLLTHFLLPKLTLNSLSTLQATIRGHNDTPQFAKIDILLHQGKFHYQMNGNSITSPLQQGHIHISLRSHKLTALSQFTLAKNNTFNLSASLANFSKIPIHQQQIHGSLKVDFNDLSLFNNTFRAITQPTGHLLMNLTISKQLTAPDIQGKIHLKNSRVFIPRLGIELTKINMEASSSSSNLMNYTISAYSKKQPINIKGKAITIKNHLKNTLTIEGHNVLIMDTPEYKVYATPTLKVVMQGHNIDLSGSVNIPQAILQPTEFNNVTLLPSDQIIYTAGAPLVNQTTWKIFAKIQAQLGNDVRVKTSGFDAMVTGKATIIGKPQTITLANGRINIVKGHYNAYGKTLTISPGSFIEFINSPVGNPSFNIYATKVIQVGQGITDQGLNLNNLTVGVAVHGSFHYPRITLFSIPTNLSQADILSYLLFGYASEKSNSANLSILLQAANALGGGTGIGSAITQLKQGLGLTELGVESETLMNAIGVPVDQQTAFVIGKRLTKNIYIRYSLGLGQGPFVPANTFELRYTINRHWTLKTDSSTLGNGADILYTIETN